MALKIMIQYNNQPVVYDIVMQEDNVYHLRLHEFQKQNSNEDYIPEKLVIRKKGMIWISDNENYTELIKALTTELNSFRKPE